MQSLESSALEPTKAELTNLSLSARIMRFLPVYGLVILTFLLVSIAWFTLIKIAHKNPTESVPLETATE